MAEELSIEKQVENALVTLKSGDKKRKFVQSVDLIINLQKFDLKKNAINSIVTVPHKIKDKRICAFFDSKVKNDKILMIGKDEFKGYSDKVQLKNLAKNYDFFIAESKLMPLVASTFGRSLGPTGKMPSPQLGILMDVNEKSVNEIIDKINRSIKVRTKEPSVKVIVGNESMNEKDLLENIMAVYNLVLKTLPRNKENIKNMEIKFTMTKPIKVSIK
ncbi:hypothetical protein COU57_05630 [Candidatus Pacearchaeota archaeon CG10_big_fil_rev_8_21_14_0_10_32_14]|nr:MAG: hypothetical protein COU57_05630 [Candidatus Pacearchaeota archaeon CG10_big_fil_rev_8_21_14_0_10_32_14]